MKKTVVSLLGLVGFIAFAAQANATPDQVVVHPDLDGDGKADTVTAKIADDNQYEQILVATVQGKQTSTRLEFDSWNDAPTLRVVDLNADGKQEIVVKEISGANTEHFSIQHFDGGELQPVRTQNGSPIRILEGGGMSAIADHGCETTGGVKRLVTVGAVLDWDTMLYTGERTAFTVQNGVATEVSRTTATGPRDSATFQVNPDACA